MKDSGPIPIRIYREFTKQDWPNLPEAAQDALANFLVRLQKNPDTSEIITYAQRDTSGRFGYEFSPGYVVYWQIVRNAPGEFLQHLTSEPLRIEVLAVVKTEINFSDARQKTALSGDSPTIEEQDQIQKVYSRTATLGNLAMWGTLHVSRHTGKVKGWIVDSWSQGPPYLNPKMHWVSFPDYKLHHMRLNLDFNSSMQVGPEDTETEPERLIFIRATLSQWEQDWLEQESKKTS